MPEDDIIDLPDDDIIDVPEAPPSPRERNPELYGDVVHTPRYSQLESTATGITQAIPGAKKIAARVHSWVDPEVSYEESKKIMETGERQSVAANPGQAAFGNVLGNVALGALLPGGAVARGAGLGTQVAATGALAAAQSLGEQDVRTDNLAHVGANVAEDVFWSTLAHGAVGGAGKLLSKPVKAGKERLIRGAKNIVNKEDANELRAWGFKTKEIEEANQMANKAQVMRNQELLDSPAENIRRSIENTERNIPGPWIKENITVAPFKDMQKQATTIKDGTSKAISALLKEADQGYAKIAPGQKPIKPEVFTDLAQDIQARSPTAVHDKYVAPMLRDLKKNFKKASERGGYTLDELYSARRLQADELNTINSAGAATEKAAIKAANLRHSIKTLDRVLEQHLAVASPQHMDKMVDLRNTFHHASDAENAFNRKVVEKLPSFSQQVNAAKEKAIGMGSGAVVWVERQLRTGQGQKFTKYAEELARAVRQGTLAQTVYLLTRQDPEFAEQVRKGTTKETE